MPRDVSAERRDRIVEAFENLLETRRAAAGRVLTKDELAEHDRDRDVLERAAGFTVEHVVKALADLQLDFGSAVDDLSSRLAAEAVKLADIRRAVEVERRRAAELRDVRLAADALDVLMQENEARDRDREAEARIRRDALDAEITSRRAAWERERQEFEAAERARAEALVRQRRQSEADFAYERDRERRVEADEYAERRARLERTLDEQTQEKEKAWSERERLVVERESALDGYRVRIAAMPAELESAVRTARETAAREAEEVEQFKAAMLEREAATSEKAHQLRVASLQAAVDQNAARIAGLAAQLQAALQQAQTLALRAVEGANK